MRFRIHRMAEADVARVSPLFDAYRQFYHQPSDPALAERFLRERQQAGESVVLFAEGGTEVLGFTQLYPLFSSISTGRTWLLNDLFVAPAARRRGVGEALLAAAAEFGRESGAAALMLETMPDNQQAQALYAKAGWQREYTYWYHLPLDPP